MGFWCTFFISICFSRLWRQEKTSTETKENVVEETSEESKAAEKKAAIEQSITYLGNEYCLTSKN